MTNLAIEVKNLSKKFRIYHENRNSVYEAIKGIFSKKKYYENLNVLKNISFSVEKGEMFGIIGKNGAGKTTLLRIISGIYKQDSGTVLVNGSLTPLLGLGVGFEIDMTARDNIIRYGMILGFKKSDIIQRVDAIIKFAGLEKFLDTKLKNFSTGMYQRLAFATAIQVDPDILLIDEALFTGDLGFQQKCFYAIMTFKKRNKSIILVSHDMRPIEEHCDRAMFLNNGIIESIGNPKKVIEDYKKSLFLR